MITIPASTVRIPAAARDALARGDAVTVLGRGKRAFIIVSPDVLGQDGGPRPATGGRPLHEVLPVLLAGPRPDAGFADDLEANRATA